MPRLAAQQPPPPHYYADNLRQLLDHVQHHYADLLSVEEQAFISLWAALSTSAQRMLARLFSRKGPWLRTDRLNYAEVTDTGSTLEELERSGLVTLNGAAPADALLAMLTQAETVALFPMSAFGAKRTKQQRINFIVGRYPDALILHRLAARMSWVSIAQYDVFHRARLLFFGDPYQDLTAFVLQDLGMLTYERYALHADTRQFADRAAFDRYLELLRLNSLSHRQDELDGLAGCVMQRLIRAKGASWPNRLEQRLGDKILNRLGRRYERRGDIVRALCCYAHSHRHPARERRVRLLKSSGQDRRANALVEEIRRQPWSAAEQDYAARFGRRRRRPLPTTRLTLAEPPSERIEIHAMSELCQPGDACWHLENGFPLALAGLAYWPVIFADVPGAFVNPFQAAPVDLYWEDFVHSRRAALEVRERVLAENFAGVLRATYEAKFGVANRLVSWTTFTPDVLEATLQAVPGDQARGLAQHVLHNLSKARVGFPDLFVARGDGSYEFVEVKGPTDQLQPAQRVWLHALADLGMPARVVKFTR